MPLKCRAFELQVVQRNQINCVGLCAVIRKHLYKLILHCNYPVVFSPMVTWLNTLQAESF